MNLQGQRVTVMGLGRFGGGVGAARWLVAQGADVLITDMAAAGKLEEPLREIQDLVDSGFVRLRLGEHNVSDFTTCDLVVANPAVPKPWENRFLRSAEAAGIPITTEICLLVSRLLARLGRERTIAITGSVGKSTTTAMIAHALKACGRDVLVGGNLGGSLLQDLDSIDVSTRPWVVLELSSAMLHYLEAELKFSPHIAVVTNLAPNHLDWHGTLEHYTASKQHLLRHQQPADAAILGHDLGSWAKVTPAKTVVMGHDSWSGPLRVPGEHNRINASMAAAALREVEPMIPEPRIDEALSTFPGLAHRLELVGEVEGVRYYNDSKCTTPEAAMRAIEALAHGGAEGTRFKHIHLIAGGYDKKIDLSAIARMGPRLAGLYTIGVTGPTLDAASAGSSTPCATLERAVSAARARVKAGEVVLLSPACASWDQFTNFEERGDMFRTLVTAPSMVRS